MRTAPCGASTTRRAAPWRACLWLHLLSSAHLPLDEGGRDRELGAGEPEGFARDLFSDPFHLEQHLARLDLGNPVLDVALAAAHAHLERLLGDRHVRKHPDPDLAAALDVARHRAARG